MKIVCVESLGLPEKQFQDLQAHYTQMGHSFQYYMDRREDAQTLVARMHDADIVVISNIKLSAETLAQCPNLKLLSVAFTGLDHIDLDYCQNHNIAVVNAAGYSTTAVSELAIGLMLDLLRRVTPFDAEIRAGKGRNGFAGLELRGKTVGVIGTGAIGTATIRLLLAFGCNVLAYSRSHRPEVEALGVRYLPLHEMLPQCDIVTLHVPLNKDTHHLLGASEIALMRPGALLINTARGNVADIPAVAEALNSHHLGGAAFDVFEQEPPIATDHPLLHAPNCLCVPHIAFATHEAFVIRGNIVFDTVNKFLAQ